MSTQSRMSELRELLNKSKYFKLVCGAGNENPDEVRRLSTIYALAGTNGFDVSATPSIVKSCIEGINKAYELADSLNINIPNRPFITVSVGMSGDHHVRKATIDLDKCISCGACIKVCPTTAINKDFVVQKEKCIGCGHCGAACPTKVNAISYKHNAKTLAKILPECIAAGAENIELHAAVEDNGAIMDEWKIVSESNPNNLISICLDRLHLSNFHLVERIKRAKEIAGDRMIVQADGIPMSGGSDDFNTTLQAIAIADIINKEFYQSKKNKEYKDFYILLSGGTNGKTAELAQYCKTPWHGLSIGTHARKIVKEYTQNEDIYKNKDSLNKAVTIAKDLVDQMKRFPSNGFN